MYLFRENVLHTVYTVIQKYLNEFYTKITHHIHAEMCNFSLGTLCLLLAWQPVLVCLMRGDTLVHMMTTSHNKKSFCGLPSPSQTP